MGTLEDKNIDVIKRAFALLLEKGDLDGFFAHVSDQCELHEPASLPYGGVYRGKEEMRRGITKAIESWGHLEIKKLNYAVGGDEVVVHLDISGVMRKTGKRVSMQTLELWRVRDGKVVELRPFLYDTAAILDACK